MATWQSDLCLCKSNYEIVNDDMVGELIEPCEFHTSFEDTLADNRLKNLSITEITNFIDMSGKSIGFTFTDGIIRLQLYNFTQEDIDIVNSLNLNVITEGV